MRNTKPLLFGLLVMMLEAGCSRDGMNYQSKLNVKTSPASEFAFKRYEEVLFHLDTARFQEELLSVQKEYLPFLEGDLTDPAAVLYLKGFVEDTFSVYLFNKVQELYPDLDDVSVQIACVYRHFNHYYPEISLPRIIYTCVSGVNPEIPPVMLCGDALVISLDWYLEHDGVYDRLGMPHYRSERTGIVYLGRDLGQVLYLKFLSDKHVQTTILDEMIYQGKMLLFVEALCPEISDETLLGYSKEQLAWAKSNEGDLWADIVGNQRLYSSEYELFRMFFADGPFTNEYSYDAPARLGEYVGLNIVRSYFGSHDITLQELMENNDFQGIFQDSRYKPKK